MPRPKRGSRVLEFSKKRVTVLETLILPPSPNKPALERLVNAIEQTQAKISQHNTTLSVVDQLSEEIQGLEQLLITLNEQLQALIIATYGRNSPEARQVSSVRRTSPKRRKAPPTDNPSTDTAA
jgi:hypothetical protein